MADSSGKPAALEFHAGDSAYREIRQHGFSPGRIGTFAGASGGAKWLVLSQLDRVVARRLLPHLDGPVHTIGTSIGAWRFACYCQADPLAAIERFEEAYLAQSYSADPDRDEISARSTEILDHVLGDTGIHEILSNPRLRMSVLAVRSRNVAAPENRVTLGAALVSAALLNGVSRRALGAIFDRVLFHDSRDEPPFATMRGFPLYRVPLTSRNLKPAIVATGSIPLVLNGVRDIEGAPRGMYRDGGIVDYHLDFPHSSADRLGFYLHFYNFIKPGWFDKRLVWRRSLPTSLDRTILISPSAGFVARLPNGRIPDRHDFTTMTPAARVRAWREVVNACRQLADELEDVLDKDRMAEVIRPLPAASQPGRRRQSRVR